MKYLDAKKKLVFMMATAKYIRIYLDKNPTIDLTEHLVKAVMTRALPTWVEEYTITMSDLVDIATGIKSLLLTTQCETINHSENVTITTQKYNSLAIDDYAKFCEILRIAPGYISSIQFAELLNTINTIENINIAIDDTKLIKSNDLTAIIPNITVAVNKLQNILSDDVIRVFNNLGINTRARSFPVKVVHGILETTHQLALELMEIKNAITCDSNIIIPSDILLQALHTIHTGGNSTIKILENFNLPVLQPKSIESFDRTKLTETLLIGFLIVWSVEVNSSLYLRPDFKLATDQVVSIEAIEALITKADSSIIAQLPAYLGIDQNIALSDEVIMEIEEFITMVFSIETSFTVKELAELITKKSNPFESYAKLYVNNETVLDIFRSADIIHNYTISFEDSVTLGQFRYSIIMDHDQKLLSTLDMLILDDMIYVSQD